MEYVLGLDIGSSAAKVGLFTPDGEAVAVATRCYPTSEPLPGYKEQDPELWWAAAADGIRQVSRRVSPARIVALGAAGHISSFTFVDETGALLRPALGFQDQRALMELEELCRMFTREELALHLGIDLPPAATWPLPKLMWFQKHETATLDKARCLLQAKDFVNLRLTGEFASDVSSNRGLVNLSSGRIAEPVFSRLRIRHDLVPPLRAPEEVMGRVCGSAAGETGLRPGLPVVTGWNDLNASVLGSGAVHAGDAFNITGTSEHIGVVTARNHSVPQLVCAPFLPGRMLLYGVTSCGGGSLEWYGKVTGRPIEELLSLAGEAAPGAESLLFLPYLEGERSPIWDARASGAFVGIRALHNQRHFVRAILEGVAFGLRQILELVERNVEAGGQPVVLSGGAARAPLWNQIKADVLGRPAVVARTPHAGMLGAAMLAGVAAGWRRDCLQAARAMAKVSAEFVPGPDRSARYQASYSRYCELYPALRELSARLHADRLEVRNADA